MTALIRRLAVAIFVVLALFAAITAAAAAAADYDEYEYEDDDASAAAAATPSATGFVGRFQSKFSSEQQAAAAVGGGRPVYKWSDVQLSSFKIEIALLATTLAYIISYFIGRRRNKTLVTNWYKLTADIWEGNFAHIGDAGHRILRDGPHAYILSASGRVHVKSIYGRLRLASRYDWAQKLVMLFTGKSSSGSADRLTLTATLDGSESDGMTLAIVLKTLVRNITDRRWDLGEFPKKREMLTSVRSGPFPSEQYTVLAEAPEFLNNVWEDSDVRRALWATLGLDADGKGDDAYGHPIIEQIVLTDLPSSRPAKLADLESAPRTLTFVLRLPDLANLTAKDQTAIREACELFITFIDYIGQHGRVAPETKAKLLKARLASQQHILKAAEEERKEELAKKKAAEKRERDKAAAKLSPDEARKYEERERKKELKRAQGKKMKKGKVTM
ncbi:Coiled-coil domain-containing protein 47 [Geranomyces variabilis]|uniref:Coiled-coil domain-containing protein 47 n=1 Tax=Geranomyces variabilis TaxID=109894 RepID=A0AAD5TK91_9FUNG|nr:Coiled-coil domain-containing protein 47 [Geranomyces variabilis]